MTNQLAFQISLIFLINISVYIPSFGQDFLKKFLAQIPKEELPIYQIDSSQEGYFKVHMTFESFQVENSEELTQLKSKEIIAVDLVYTLFPENKDFTTLNTNRLRSLSTVFPALLAKKNISWRCIGQSACKTRDDANKFFHGFVIYYRTFSPMQKLRFPEELFLTYSTNLEKMDFRDSTVLYNLYRKNYIAEDSTVYKVLERKLSAWEKSLLVIDWTGSMYPFGFQVLTWLKFHVQDTSHFGGLVLFNDGDDKAPGEKIIGRTGGIYHTASTQWVEIINMMVKAQQAGQGGYDDENDLEALIKGQELFPKVKNIVLIADSQSFVRDLVLLNYFVKRCKENKQTLRIILCGIADKVVRDYIYMAAKTQGSVHTLKQDLEKLYLDEEGAIVNEEGKYYVFRDGMFDLVSRKRKKKKKLPSR